jgi:hypothetical protein
MNYADALAIAVNVTRFYLPYELTRYFVAAGVIAGLVWLIKRTPWRSRQIQPRLPARKDRVREIASGHASSICWSQFRSPGPCMPDCCRATRLRIRSATSCCCSLP